MQGDAGEPPTREDLVVARGRRYTLIVTGDAYEILDGEAPDEPVARFTGDGPGADASLAEFERLEREDGRRPLPAWLKGLAVVFILGLALWGVAGTVANGRFLTNGNGDGGLASNYASVQQLLAVSRIGFFVWVSALAIVAFSWLAVQVRGSSAR